MSKKRQKMQVIFLDRCKYGGLRVFGVLLFGYSLAGCAVPISPLAGITPSAGQGTKQLPVRAIIYFQHPTADNKSMFAAISQACNCQPAFFRPYRDDALIYEITLSKGNTFAIFAKALMQHATQFGIKAVEQDRIMQHQ
jgi:hypothetical protein